MKRILFLGAGAEIDLGFKSGNDFTWDTFYRKKGKLYNAERCFYKDRLSKGSKRLPKTYSAAFLFYWNHEPFKLLVRNIFDQGSDLVSEILGEYLEFNELETRHFKDLYNSLIDDSDRCDGDKDTRLLSALPSDSHYGILERYYSSIINPKTHSQSFWKLINFYWSAFFSIQQSLTGELKKKDPKYESGDYGYVLNNLEETLDLITGKELIESVCNKECYYKHLHNAFEGVITTNYTPFSRYVVDLDDDKIAFLSGALWLFEDLETLSVMSYKDAFKDKDSFIFPFLMCQSPVKPIIDYNQIQEYSKAIDMLKDADCLAVLGYSFCNEDAHIASIVSTAFKLNKKLRLTIFVYVSDEDKDIVEMKMKEQHDKYTRILHIVEKELNRFNVSPVKDCRSPAFLEYVSSGLDGTE